MSEWKRRGREKKKRKRSLRLKVRLPRNERDCREGKESGRRDVAGGQESKQCRRTQKEREPLTFVQRNIRRFFSSPSLLTQASSHNTLIQGSMVGVIKRFYASLF